MARNFRRRESCILMMMGDECLLRDCSTNLMSSAMDWSGDWISSFHALVHRQIMSRWTWCWWWSDRRASKASTRVLHLHPADVYSVIYPFYQRVFYFLRSFAYRISHNSLFCALFFFRHTHCCFLSTGMLQLLIRNAKLINFCTFSKPCTMIKLSFFPKLLVLHENCFSLAPKCFHYAKNSICSVSKEKERNFQGSIKNQQGFKKENEGKVCWNSTHNTSTLQKTHLRVLFKREKIKKPCGWLEKSFLIDKALMYTNTHVSDETKRLGKNKVKIESFIFNFPIFLLFLTAAALSWLFFVLKVLLSMEEELLRYWLLSRSNFT